MAPPDDDSTTRPHDPGAGSEQASGAERPHDPGAGSESQRPRERIAGATESALRALEDRLERASDAAERLIAEAATAAGRQTPPAGWAPPGDGPNESESAAGLRDDDLATIVSFVRSLRDLIPPDLQQRLGEALRELLLALRALIDWYLERLEQRRNTPTPVEDIPIL